MLDALESAGCEKAQDRFPVVRRAIRELQRRRLALDDRAGAFGCLFAETRGRHPVAPVERIVEPAQAREAAREGDLRDGQRRFSQKLFGQQQPAGQQKLDWRYAELLLHDAANLPRAELELVRDFFESGLLVEDPFFETLNDQLRDALRVVHRRVPRRQLRPAAQAGTEAGLFGFLRRSKETAVGLLGVFTGQIGRQ